MDGEDQDVVLRQQQLDFSCPYCFEDFDITSLCYHLEDEHCFESTPAVSAISLICYSHQDYGVIHIHPWVGLPGQVRTQMFAIFFLIYLWGVPGVLFWAHVGTTKYVGVSFSLRGYDCFFSSTGNSTTVIILCVNILHIVILLKKSCILQRFFAAFVVARSVIWLQGRGTCCEDSIFCIGTTYMIVWFVG